MKKSRPKKIRPGLQAVETFQVQAKDLAVHWGSDFPVLASPVLIGWFEEACMKATDHLLASTETTVGLGFDVVHLSPSPAQSTIRILARLQHVKDKKLVFNVDAHDSSGLISTGILHRAIVEKSSFLDKVHEKLGQSERKTRKDRTPVLAQTNGQPPA